MRPAVGVEDSHIVRPRDIPQLDGGLDVGDGAPRRRQVHTAEQEEVSPARALQSDVIEGEGYRVSPFPPEPLISMPWNAPSTRRPPSFSRHEPAAWRE